MTILVTGRRLACGAGALHSFETVRQCEGEVVAPPAAAAGLRALLTAADIPCLETGMVEPGIRCIGCERLVNVVPAPDRNRITVRCVWTDEDLVAALMIPAERLASVPSDARARDAARLAADYESDLLLMIDSGVLEGVLRRSVLEWIDPERPVRQLAQRKCWVIDPDATLGDALTMMLDQDAEFLLVVLDGQLEGMLTRARLLDLVAGRA